VAAVFKQAEEGADEHPPSEAAEAECSTTEAETSTAEAVPAAEKEAEAGLETAEADKQLVDAVAALASSTSEDPSAEAEDIVVAASAPSEPESVAPTDLSAGDLAADSTRLGESTPEEEGAAGNEKDDAKVADEVNSSHEDRTQDTSGALTEGAADESTGAEGAKPLSDLSSPAADELEPAAEEPTAECSTETVQSTPPINGEEHQPQEAEAGEATAETMSDEVTTETSEPPLLTSVTIGDNADAAIDQEAQENFPIVKNDSTDSAFEATEDTLDQLANNKHRDGGQSEDKNEEETISLNGTTTGGKRSLKLLGDSEEEEEQAKEIISDLPPHTNGHKEISIQ
jgi:hypothetical protein